MREKSARKRRQERARSTSPVRRGNSPVNSPSSSVTLSSGLDSGNSITMEYGENMPNDEDLKTIANNELLNNEDLLKSSPSPEF